MIGFGRTLFIGMIVMPLVIVLTTTSSDGFGSGGIVVTAIGGLLFIMGMTRRKREDRGNGEGNE